MVLTQYFDLDIVKPPLNKLRLVNGDTANTFVITIKENGAAVTLDATLHKIIAVFKRADGEVYTQDATTGLSFTTGGVVTIDLRPASFRTGTNKITLQIYKRENSSATEYPLLLTTQEQSFNARAQAIPDAGAPNAPSQLPMLEQYVLAAKSYANGNTGTREGENTDNSKYYKDLAEAAVEQGVISPSVTAWMDDNEDFTEPIIEDEVDAWLDAHPEATTTVQDDSITRVKLKDVAFSDIADVYSASMTYAVGDYVFYNHALYRCITAITTAESFTAAHWTVVAICDDISEIRHDVDDITVKSQNLFNPTTAQDGYYCNPNSGTVSENANLLCTDFIPVSEGDVLWFNVTSVRYIAAFKANKTAVRTSGVTVATASGEYTVPSGIAYLRLSFTKARLPQDISTIMVNVGSALLPYTPYGAVYVNEEAIRSLPVNKITGLNIEQTESLLGSDSVVSVAATLASGTHLTISTAPRHIKKNVGISALMKFSSFTSVSIGKGFEEYRGRWISVDGTNITPYYYNGTNTVASTPIPHGLTIADYLQISMYVGQDGYCEINLNTTSGTFQTSVDFGYEWNYAPFIFGAQAMTDVKLSYSCADLRCPLWLFGDSYMGVAENRVAGQIKNAGFFNILIDSLAGIKSEDSYSELLRMLVFASPKYIVWTLGMNGTDSATITSLQTLIEKCDEKDIELILYITPNVPNKDHATLNAYVKSTGKRYVDAYDAVGANASGQWYGYGTQNDMLSTDNVHPSIIGAKALAMRFLVDAPEIMQYGLSSGTVSGDISGDL